MTKTNENKVEKTLQIKNSGYTSYEKDFEKLLIAARVHEKTKAVKFLLIHKNHFLQDIGVTSNTLFVIKVEGMKNKDIEASILSNLDWLIETTGYKLATQGKELFYRYIKSMLKSISGVYKQRKEELSDKLTEEEILHLVTITWAEKIKTDKKQTKHFTSICKLGAQWILPGIIGGISKTLLETYNKQKMAVGDDYNKCIDIWRECDIIEPIFTISICSNKLCKHYEFLISSNPKLQKNCSKCGLEQVNITLYKVNEPFTTLKLEQKDLSIFLSAYIKTVLNFPIEVVPECYVSNDSEEVQVDIFLKNPPTIFECKVYEDRQITTWDKLLNIYKDACQQLASSMKKLETNKGYIVTNLSLNEQQLSKLEEETGKIIKGQEFDIRIIAGSSVEEFLENLSNELEEINEQIINTNKAHIPENHDDLLTKFFEKTGK